MHPFLRAIGFDTQATTEREVELLLDNLFHTYDHREAVKEETGTRAFVELSKSFGPEIGIRVCGELDGYGFHRLYYYPYLNGTGITSREEVSVDNKTNGNCYSGMLDEGKVGVSLIFYVLNPARLRQESHQNHLHSSMVTTTLSGLSLSGTILLPMKNNDQEHNESRAEYYQRHENLVTAAKNGSQEAIESLTMEDMDIYAMIARRIQHEDLYSIVDTYFMPYGMESDQYQILGTIRFVTKVRNTLTKDYLYQLTVECNGLVFDICINQKDLMGEPDVGRRFKGNIWLQGRINFE